MSCFFPLLARRQDEPNENGKRPLVFHTTYEDAELEVPCGKCEGCRADQAREWAIRMYHESQEHVQCSFLTLTYAPVVMKEDSCWIAPKELVKKDLQDFIKRLRKKYKFRYFACGEYGDDTHRPHYHMIIFGQDFLDKASFNAGGTYSNLDVERAWGHGRVEIAKPELGAFAYVAGYCTKKVGQEDTFGIASTVPPLGYTWFVKHYDDLMRTGQVIFGDKEFPIPKAYFRFANKDELYYNNVSLEHVKAERAEKMRAKGFSEYSKLQSKRLLSISRRKMKEEML